MSKTCSGCIRFVKSQFGAESGECHDTSPTVLMVGGVVKSYRPAVLASDFSCSKFEAIKVVDVPVPDVPVPKAPAPKAPPTPAKKRK